MARDGSGIYSKPSGTTFVFDTTIDQEAVNLLMDDIATEITASVPRDGSAPMTGALTLPGSPTLALHAATKGYVDTLITGGPSGVTNSALANMAQNTIKGRITASTGSPEDLTATQVKTILGISYATSAQIFANTADKIIDTDAAWSSAVPVAITYAASVSPDMSTFINASMTLTGNLTLAAPTNTKAGQSGCIALTQDATGSRTVTFNAAYVFASGVDFVASTAANAVDYLFYYVPVVGTVVISAIASAA